MTSGSHFGSPNSNPYFAPSSTTSANSGGLAATSSVISRKKCSNPPGLITSIILAGTSPAFHIECSASDGSFHSPTIGTGATYSYTFPTAGSFDYTCSIHPFMHGTVVVTK